MKYHARSEAHYRPFSYGVFFKIFLLSFTVFISPMGQSPGDSGRVFYPQGQNEAAKKNFDGDRTSAKLQDPSDIVVAPDGSIIISDGGHNTIRQIDPAGNVKTIAGNAFEIGNTDGKALASTFSDPAGLALSVNGDLYIVNHSILGSGTIRKITPQGDVSTIKRRSGDGSFEFLCPRFPNAIALGKDGTLFISESTRITTLTPDGVYSTLAGHETEAGYGDGTGSEARFRNIISIVVADDGNLLVSDKDNNVIRKVTTKGVVTTHAGKAGTRGHMDGTLDTALFSLPVGIAFDPQGNLYIAELGSGTIRMICNDGQVITIAGIPNKEGFTDGPSAEALFNRPTQVAVDPQGNVIVVDCFNNAVRKITKDRVVTTIVGTPNKKTLKKA
jgi:sugar lactone lactonase YvrE